MFLCNSALEWLILLDEHELGEVDVAVVDPLNGLVL